MAELPCARVYATPNLTPPLSVSGSERIGMMQLAQLFVLWAACLPAALAVSTTSCPEACAELQTLLPIGGVTTIPGVDTTYWASQIQAIQPACYAQPATTQQVAAVIKVASKYSCPFAIRGSGHSDVAGASNLANGIVLNLASFKDVTLSSDKTFATIGTGNQWGDVYTALDLLGYTVVGGREFSVGTGGLTLGGGISYFSGRYGFACDNVLAYEVVLANGTAANITQSNAADLYRALRGGGNNFAVVTRYHLAAYPYSLMQGGLTIWSDSKATQASLISAFMNFAQNAQNDPAAAMFLSLTSVSGALSWIGGLYYTSPSPPVPATAAYKPFFTQQLNSSKVLSTQRSGLHAGFATELGQGQPSGLREQFHTGTYIANAELLAKIFSIFRDVVAKTQTKLADVLGGSNPLEVFQPGIAFQPIPRNILLAQSRRGGNVLGLNNPNRPRMLLSMAWPWRMPANDAVFIGAMDEIVRRANVAARQMGLFDEFIYMNYARTGEQVVRSYGSANVQFMHAVSAKYDPTGVFQKLVPGGFKLP